MTSWQTGDSLGMVGAVAVVKRSGWVGVGPPGGGEGGGGDKGKRRGAEWQCAKDEEDSS